MSSYPINLHLDGCTVVIVGAGEVGQRKIAGVLPACPRFLRVFDPALSDSTLKKRLEGLFARFPQTVCTCLARSPQEMDFADATLAFAATNDKLINQMVFDYCTMHKVLCNRADAEDNNFTVPAKTTRDGICITVSTMGASPALAKRLRLDIESLIGKRYGRLSHVMQRIRPLVLALGRPTPENTAIFTALVQSPLGEFLAQQNRAAAQTLLKEILPESLHVHIEKVLYDS